MTDDDFGTALRERLDELAALGMPESRPTLDSLDAVPLEVVSDEPAARDRPPTTTWWAVAAAVVLVVGLVAVVVDRSPGDDRGAVATDPDGIADQEGDDADVAPPEDTGDDGEPSSAIPAGEVVTFTIESPDGDLEGWMRRTAGDDGLGNGFCVGVDVAGGCGDATALPAEPQLLSVGTTQVDGLEEHVAAWLVPDDVDELTVTWQGGAMVALPVVRPIEGLPGITAARVPWGVQGGVARSGEVRTSFVLDGIEPRDRARAEELAMPPAPSTPVPADGVHVGRLDQFFDDGTDAAVRVRPAQFFSDVAEAEAAAEEDGQGPLGSPFYMREDVAPPLVLAVEPSQVRIVVVDQSTLHGAEISWDGYVAHLRGDDPFPIYWAGNVVEYTIEDGQLVELDAIYLP